MKLAITLLISTFLSVFVQAQDFGVIEKYWEPDGVVNSVVRDTVNNRLYVGGLFNNVGTDERFGSQMDTLGNVDFYFENPEDGGVEVSIPDGNGGWYIGGRFTKVGDSNRYKIAHLDANGKVTAKFKNTKFSHEVKTMLLKSDTLFVGGAFTMAGNIKQYSSVRDIQNGTMAMDIPEADGLVHSSVPDGNGGVFIGGTFDNVDGVPRAGLAHIDQYGNLTSWDAKAQTNSSIYAIKLVGDTLFVGGSFYKIDGSINPNIAAINKNTGALYPWAPSPNSAVYTIDVAGNEVFFGGQFTEVGGVTRNNVAVCNKSTGTLKSWNPNFNGWVKEIKVYDNKIYVGGRYTTVGSQTRNRIASFDLSTKALNSWNPNVATTPNWSNVESIQKMDSLIIIGGNFDSIAGVPRECLAAVHASTGVATSWAPSVPGNVYGMTVIDKELIIAGSFRTISGVQREGLAKFDSNFTLQPLNVYSTNQVYTVCAFGSDLFVGGFFDAMLSEPSGGLAAIDVVGDSVLAWNSFITSISSSVNAIELYNNTLYVGGNYTMIGSSIRNSLSAIDLNNESVTNWDPGLNQYSTVNDLHVHGNELYVGGDFNSINGQFQYDIAKYNLTTHSLVSWNPSVVGSEVFTIATDANNVYIGGSFSGVGAQSRTNFAQVDQITASVGTLDPSPNANVLSIKLNGNKLLLGGYFSQVKSPSIPYLSRNRMAELDISTREFSDLNPNIPGNNRYVKHIALSGNQIYVSGSYLQIGTLLRKNFVAYNYSTGDVIDWAPNPEGEVRAMAVKDSLLYIGGAFNYVDNIFRLNVAALNVVTESVDSLNNQAPVGGSGYGVSSLAIMNSTLFVGGSFSALNGQTRNNLGSFNTNTGLLNSFNPVTNGTVTTIVPKGSTVFVGGTFSLVGGQTRARVAELNSITGVPTTWSTTAAGTINDLHLNGTELIVGGDFTQMGGQTRTNLASISTTTGLANTWNPTLTGVGAVQVITRVNNEYWVGKTNTTGWNPTDGFQKVNTTTAAVSDWNSLVNASSLNSVTPFYDSLFLGGNFDFNRKLSYLALLVPCNGASSVETHLACESYTWIDGVTYYTSDTTATKTFITAGGCDSVVSLHLTILNSSLTVVSETACDSFAWNNVTYYSSTNTPIDTLTNISGCDSILNLHLVISNSSMGTDTITACDSYTWINGITYYASNNTAIDTLQSIGGCDSILNLDLTILTIDSSVIQSADTLMAVASGLSYQWIDCATNTIVNGATAQVFVPMVTGNYKVEIANGVCVDTSACYQVNLCDNQAAYTFTDNGTGNFDFTDVSLGNYTQVHWSFGDGTTNTNANPNHVYQANGNYIVVLTINDANSSINCVSHFMDTISVIGIGSPVACKAGFSVYYDSVNTSVNVVNSSVGINLSYSWDFGDGTTSIQQFPSHTYATNGPFNLCLTIDDGNGCTDTYCDSISNQGVWFRTTGFDLAVEGAEPNSIAKIDLSNNINVYPNPVHNQANIEITNWPTNAANIVVRNMSGKKIYSKELEPISNNETITINTSKWASGVYFMEVTDGVNLVIEKIVVN
jgi:PKD repeat protein